MRASRIYVMMAAMVATLPVRECACACGLLFQPTRPWHIYAKTDGRSHRFRKRGRIVHVKRNELDHVEGLLDEALAYVQQLRTKIGITPPVSSGGQEDAA